MVSPTRPRPASRKKDRGQIKDFARGVRRARRAVGTLTDEDLDKMTEETLAEKKYLDPDKNRG